MSEVSKTTYILTDHLRNLIWDVRHKVLLALFSAGELVKQVSKTVDIHIVKSAESLIKGANNFSCKLDISYRIFGNDYLCFDGRCPHFPRQPPDKML